MPEPKPPKKQPNRYARFSGIVFQMIAIIALGTYIGVKLDQNFPNQYDAYTISLALVSVFISLYVVIKQITKSTNR